MTEQHDLGEAYARSTDPGTSHAAAQSVEGSEASRMEQKVLEELRLWDRTGGLTTHELSDATKIPYESVTPRIKPLVKKGLVVDSGERRTGNSNRKCIVWKAVTKGQTC